MRKAHIWLIAILAGFFLLGCSSSDDQNVTSGSDSGTETSFNFTMASFLSQQKTSSSVGVQANFTANQIMTGQLTVTPSGGGTAQVFDWSIYFDETTWDVQSNKTIILPPGTYEFALLLVKGDQQYAGLVDSVAISDGTFDVPMTIRPIIGNTVTDVTLLASLAEFKFQYDPAELAAASLVNPQMGIVVNGGTEVIYSINSTTGISDTWINLDEGANTLSLKLYDGSLQVGRSITAQESVIVTAGLNITMDLVALHGETTFALTEAGGDATFSFNIPSEVVDESGGLGNLQVLFSIVGPNNLLDENVLTLTLDGTGDYEATITLSNKQFDEVTLSLAFTDTSVSELLGSCAMQATLDTTQRTLNCDITLRRRAIIGGSLLATLGINVLNTASEPVPGAVVSENGNVLGITGSGAFGTEGYLKIYKTAGSYTITAEKTEKYGDISVTLSPLTISNEEIILNQNKIVGVWKMDRPGDMFSYMILFPDNTFLYGENGENPEPEDGVEVGTYTFDPVANLFTVDLTYDDNTYPGGWSGLGTIGIQMVANAEISSDGEVFTANAISPFVGPQISWNRVHFNDAHDIVGIWKREIAAPRFHYLVLFPDFTFFYAENGEHPEPEDGLEVGTYSFDPSTDTIVINLTFDDNTYPGGSSGLGTIGSPTEISAILSPDGETLDLAGVITFNRAFHY